MSVYNFFLNSPIIVNQDARLSAVNATNNDTMYDYILKINVSGVTSMNSLFTNATYEQNPEDNRYFDSILNTNNAIVYQLLSNSRVSITSTNTSVTSTAHPNWNSFPSNLESMGQRLLEIVATKIFGNPLATAAIVNDQEFVSPNVGFPHQTIMTGFAVSMNLMRNDFFNQYVVSDRIEYDQNNMLIHGDMNSPIPYNLQCTQLEVPMFLTGSLRDSGGNLIDTAFAALLSGPDVGGNRMVGGSYNVPLLFVIHD